MFDEVGVKRKSMLDERLIHVPRFATHHRSPFRVSLSLRLRIETIIEVLRQLRAVVMIVGRGHHSERKETRNKIWTSTLRRNVLSKFIRNSSSHKYFANLFGHGLNSSYVDIARKIFRKLP
jgi:hypothetical protein